MYVIHQENQLAHRGKYVLAITLGFAATVCAEKAVSFYHAAQSVKPSDEQVHRSLEAILRWRDAAGQQIEQVDLILQQQAYDLARESLQSPYLFQSAAAFLVAFGFVGTASYVATRKKRN